MIYLYPTGSHPFIRSKIEQSKIQAEVSGLNNLGTSAFYFPVFHSQSPSAVCPLVSLCFQKKKGKRQVLGYPNTSTLAPTCDVRVASVLL